MVKKTFNWKETVITAIITFFVGILVAVAADVYIAPFLTNNPNIELLSMEPILVSEGDNIDFIVSLENTGGSTAKELFLFAKTDSSTKQNIENTIAKGYKLNLQKDETTNATFSLEAPNDSSEKWLITLYVSTTDHHYWAYQVIYEFLSDTNDYHRISIEKLY